MKTLTLAMLLTVGCYRSHAPPEPEPERYCDPYGNICYDYPADGGPGLGLDPAPEGALKESLRKSLHPAPRGV